MKRAAARASGWPARGLALCALPLLCACNAAGDTDGPEPATQGEADALADARAMLDARPAPQPGGETTQPPAE
jgi:hypothetical protein